MKRTNIVACGGIQDSPASLEFKINRLLRGSKFLIQDTDNFVVEFKIPNSKLPACGGFKIARL